ncbi:serine/arginine repetitive matrix protein 4 [Alligator mississippiensis]|uniref:Serine/arginine repetitive matrix protein 4 n=1 Tax=Alligator mississippiensis TaxID=8496 RepID=A0A151N4G8_ALLMI|nr:serine/arginine repetitive matrix protein 4 [Alligator mississippiensis]
MASVQQGEKQLFEKFWRGTFKAVATPRPESVIVASITARKPLPRSETTNCLSYPTEDRRSEKPSGNLAQEASKTNGCVKGKDRRENTHHRSRSSLGHEECMPPPPSRGKKKKKKSTRKKRRRSPSYSPSPVKKKKKKSSKKRKRNSCQSRHRDRSREERHKARRRRSRHHSKNTEKRSISAEVQASYSSSQTLQIYSFLSAKEVG